MIDVVWEEIGHELVNFAQAVEQCGRKCAMISVSLHSRCRINEGHRQSSRGKSTKDVCNSVATAASIDDAASADGAGFCC